MPRSRLSLILYTVTAVACSKHRTDKQSIPDAGSNVAVVTATPAPSAAAADAALHVEVEQNNVRLGARQLALEPLEIRGALARARGSASTLNVTIREGAAAEALWAVLLGARGTELQRAIIERKTSSFTLALHEEQAPRREVLLVGNDQAKLIASAGARSPPTTWTLGDQVGEQAAWLALKAACSEGPCPVRLELQRKDAPKLSAFLDSWQRLGAGLPNLSLALGMSSVSGRIASGSIEAVMRENTAAFSKCYGLGLSKNAKLRGELKLLFVIGRDGVPSSVTSLPPLFRDKAVRDCVVQAVSHLQFPVPDADTATVIYPLLFSPK